MQAAPSVFAVWTAGPAKSTRHDRDAVLGRSPLVVSRIEVHEGRTEVAPRATLAARLLNQAVLRQRAFEDRAQAPGAQLKIRPPVRPKLEQPIARPPTSRTRERADAAVEVRGRARARPAVVRKRLAAECELMKRRTCGGVVRPRWPALLKLRKSAARLRLDHLLD